jgi:hypothetical protein
MTFIPPDRDDDPLAARLRAALTSEADMVQTSDDGLQNIRAGIDSSPRRPWWRHPATPALAAALVLGLMAGGIAVLAGGGDGDDVTVGPAVTSGSPTTSASGSPSPTPSETAASDTPTPAAVEGDVYVYYLGDAKDSAPRLYREIRPNPGMGPVQAALAAMLAEKPVDSDYYGPWPQSTKVLSYDVSGDTATVDLDRFVQTGGVVENVAVQQVVYTVTANDKAVKKVRLLVNGKTPPSGHFDWSQPISRAPMLDVQGLIWLLAPTEGSTVSSPVMITGYGTAFEATINWEVYRGGQKVAEGHTMGGANGEFGDFSDTVDLDPGTYEMRAFEFSAKDGSPINVDTKTFTVK